MSKPMLLRLLRSDRSSGVENNSGAGVLSNVAKSCGGNCAGWASTVGDDGWDKLDDTERLLVRAGVRVGNEVGGVACEDDEGSFCA